MKAKKTNQLKIAHLGLAGSHSFIAAEIQFGKEFVSFPAQSIAQVVKSVQTGRCNFGIIPLENTISGSIAQSYDAILNTPVFISAETILKIRHVLLSNNKSKLSSKRKIPCFSHPQVFAQCFAFMEKYPQLEASYAADSASAAQLVSKLTNPAYAIASLQASKIYKLKVILADIQDTTYNFTRFAIISKIQNTAGNKITLAFSVAHIPGSLSRILEPFARREINLTKIESRPVFAKPWEYIFLMDFEIAQGQQEDVKEAIKQIKEEVRFLSILGIYEKGKVYET